MRSESVVNGYQNIIIIFLYNFLSLLLIENSKKWSNKYLQIYFMVLYRFYYSPITLKIIYIYLFPWIAIKNILLRNKDFFLSIY